MMDDMRMERNRDNEFRITEIQLMGNRLEQIELPYGNRICGGMRYGKSQFDMP